MHLLAHTVCYAFIINCDIPMLCICKGDLFSSNVVFEKWTYNTDSQSCATVTFGMVNCVSVSRNITFTFSGFIRVPEWVLR
jgi:hypothetical protein